MSKRAIGYVCLALLGTVACSSDPSSQGQGTEEFTTYGEDYIEDKIPATDGTDGFVDGWSVKYDKFLVNFHGIKVADDGNNVVAELDKPRFVDNVIPGRKNLVTFSNIEAKAYSNVTYEIKPAVRDEQIADGASPDDLAMMVDAGFSVYVAGTASKADPNDGTKTLMKTFHWGFKTQTSYIDCKTEEDGITTVGVVVTNNQKDTSELTTHGDHLFYDSLQSGDSAKATLLRFDQKAAADDGPSGNQDGEITLQELCKENIDTSLYNVSGLPGAKIGDFVISLARTIGHFRGEGECTIERIDPVPSGVTNPCDEYR